MKGFLGVSRCVLFAKRRGGRPYLCFYSETLFFRALENDGVIGRCTKSVGGFIATVVTAGRLYSLSSAKVVGKTIDTRIPEMLGRNTSGDQQPQADIACTERTLDFPRGATSSMNVYLAASYG